MNPQPIHEYDEDDYYDEEPVGVVAKIRRWFFGEEDSHEFENENVVPEPEATNVRRPSQKPQNQQNIQMQRAIPGKVRVRKNALVDEDVKAAADGLKAGEQQIINLERCTPMAAEKMVDFLSGVCYALDGSSQRIGDRVFMFVPANIEVATDEGSGSATSRRPHYE